MRARDWQGETRVKRRDFLAVVPASVLLSQVGIARPVSAKAGPVKKGVMMMNRIAPSVSELHVAALDGTGERKVLAESAYDYNARLSRDGSRIAFTSERLGDGNSSLFVAKGDGTGIKAVADGSCVDDAAAISPDGKWLAFVSTRGGYKANIWVMDLASGKVRQLTGIGDVKGDPDSPDCYFRPAWSPDGKWIAFSSDRDTSWRGHDENRGWEHTQELSIYKIRPDGTGFAKVCSRKNWCQGSPSWSPDGKRIVFYELTTEATWGARRPEWIGRVESQIVSVDVETGTRIEHTQGAGLKVSPQYVTQDEIGYVVKGGPGEGVVKQHIPDAHTDFIFSVAGEEFGMIACMLIVLIFAFIVVRGFLKLGREGDMFSMIAVGGLLSQFGIQALVNMGVAVNLLPAKGMTLPFLSYGGSSLIAMAGGMGMMLALTRKKYGKMVVDNRGAKKYRVRATVK